ATHRLRIPHTNNPQPSSALAAKFSLQYASACALLRGEVVLADFEGVAHLAADVRRLLPLIQVRAFAESEARGELAAVMTVTLDNGTKLSVCKEAELGRGKNNPMTRDELWGKFRDCAERVLPTSSAERAF